VVQLPRIAWSIDKCARKLATDIGAEVRTASGISGVAPGAMNAGLTSCCSGLSSAITGSGLLLTTPINRVMISRGKGHAVVHAYHWDGPRQAVAVVRIGSD
jgi:hypothetical protein